MSKHPVRIERRSQSGSEDTSTRSQIQLLPGNPNQPGLLRTIGALPHAHTWRPLSVSDRDRLVEWLNALEYPEDTPDDWDVTIVVGSGRGQYYVNRTLVNFTRTDAEIWAEDEATNIRQRINPGAEVRITTTRANGETDGETT